MPQSARQPAADPPLAQYLRIPAAASPRAQRSSGAARTLRSMSATLTGAISSFRSQSPVHQSRPELVDQGQLVTGVGCHRAGALQIPAWRLNAEVRVAGKVVREKSNGILQCHQAALRAQRQTSDECGPLSSMTGGLDQDRMPREPVRRARHASRPTIAAATFRLAARAATPEHAHPRCSS